MEAIAGPSIRVWELSHVLARAGHQVTIGTPNKSPRTSSALEIRSFGGGAMADLVKAHDITVGFGYLLREYPVIRKLAPYLVMDIYDPFVLEMLHQYEELVHDDQMLIHQRAVDVVLEQLQLADFMICASDRQRDYWLGALSVANRVNPYTSAADPTLRSLIDVVPFGLPATPPVQTRSAIKGAVAGIGADDVVVLWWGGIWNWFDPLTAIDAVARLTSEIPTLKLYMAGQQHPNPKNPRMVMARRANERAAELGLLNRSVFFNRGWIPYEQRMDYLCDADIGISLHREHSETRVAFRTRFLDYFWANLPIVATVGDVLCDAAVAAGAGVAVPDGDVDAVASALRELALKPERRRRMSLQARKLAGEYSWEQVAGPLLRFCALPYRAADAGKDDVRFPRIKPANAIELVRSAYRREGVPGVARRAGRVLAARTHRLQAFGSRALETWRVDGWRGVAEKANKRLRRLTRT
ncbi:MAG TPA: glycosyltransferase family 4 protein [Candidatus Dormibacteraeota bacterium]|nr:glycosyltransferase family 4 protein [Candidatus Dormibacteraeota bacterium]